MLRVTLGEYDEETQIIAVDMEIENNDELAEN